MTDDADTALAEHPAFERGEEEYELTTTPFDVVVETSEAGGETAYRVIVTVPTLDAVVEGEAVADVVEDGWFETLELRLEDPQQAATGLDPIDPAVVRNDSEVRVTMTFTSSRPERAAENAKSLVEFVEGTWVQGIVPGYEYDEPAASLLDRATQSYDDET